MARSSKSGSPEDDEAGSGGERAGEDVVIVWVARDRLHFDGFDQRA